MQRTGCGEEMYQTEMRTMKMDALLFRARIVTIELISFVLTFSSMSCSKWSRMSFGESHRRTRHAIAENEVLIGSFPSLFPPCVSSCHDFLLMKPFRNPENILLF